MLRLNPLPISLCILKVLERFSRRNRLLRLRNSAKVFSSCALETSKWNLVLSAAFVWCHNSSLQQHLPTRQEHGKDEQEEIDSDYLPLFSEFASQGTQKLPHLRNRVERITHAIELKKSINLDIPAPKILEALTAANCHEPFCYERIELLGDAYLKWAVSTRLFLKFPELPEGELTSMRGEIISNAALYQLALEKKLQTYVRINPFVPGREATDLQELSNKVLANVVEALVGAYFAHRGHRGAQHVVNWLGIQTDYSETEVENARAGSFVSEEVLKSIQFKELEKTLRYNFGARNLLAQALTHPSSRQASMVPMYERLEFIGDAVLDYLLTKHIYFLYKDLPPGRLTDLRCAALTGESFARAMVKHSLHLHILHEAGDFDSQIKTYAKHARKMDDTTFYSYGFGGVKAPKVLGDVFQSLAGAVYIDSNLDLDCVWKVFEPLLQPLVTPEALPIHPVRELYELCNKFEKNLEWEYSSSSSSSPSTAELFVAKAVVDGKVLGRGKNIQKKMAKKLAATNAVARLKKSPLTLPRPTQETTNEEFSRQALHELCSQRGWPSPDYNKLNETGPDHAKMFTCRASLIIHEQEKQECVGQPMPTLNKAKDSAARALMDALKHHIA